MNVEIFKSCQQLELSFKFDKTIIEKVKTIKGAKFDGVKKLWSVPLESEDELISIFLASQISWEYITKQKDGPILNGAINQKFEYRFNGKTNIKNDQMFKENNGVIVILNQDDFTVKIPIPKLLWSKLFVLQRISSTEKEWTFAKELLLEFHKICLELNITVIFKV